LNHALGSPPPARETSCCQVTGHHDQAHAVTARFNDPVQN